MSWVGLADLIKWPVLGITLVGLLALLWREIKKVGATEAREKAKDDAAERRKKGDDVLSDPLGSEPDWVQDDDTDR